MGDHKELPGDATAWCRQAKNENICRAAEVMKVLIADDHELVRQGLRYSLSALPRAVEVVEASNAEEVRAALESELDLDLVILDLLMPGSPDMGLLSLVCNRIPEVPVVVLSASEDDETMRQAVDLGASGFIPKSSASEVVLKAVDLVLAGGVYLPRILFRRMAPPGASPDDAEPDMGSERMRRRIEDSLTGRQIEVLRMLGRGLSNKAIARELHLSENTVKIHVAAVLRGLKVANRTQAGVVAQKIGLD